MALPRSPLALLFPLLAAVGPAARADEKVPDPKPAAGSEKPAEGSKRAPLRVLTDAEAAPILEGLKRVPKTKAVSEALPAFDALCGVTHPGLEPALVKLLTHDVPEVAARAARALGERAGATTAATLWKAWSSPANEKRMEVRAGILDALGTMKAPLDAKQYLQVERLFTDAASPVAMEAVTRYFAAIATDKRPCKVLALWLDEPTPASLHDGSNPPKEWWEARWKLWDRTRPGAIEALKAITGQDFATSEQAKAWFTANRAFGVRW